VLRLVARLWGHGGGGGYTGTDGTASGRDVFPRYTRGVKSKG